MNLTARKVNSKAKIPPQIGRHAILSEISIANLRPEQSFLFDPMPPTNPVVEYTPTVRLFEYTLFILIVFET